MGVGVSLDHGYWAGLVRGVGVGCALLVRWAWCGAGPVHAQAWAGVRGVDGAGAGPSAAVGRFAPFFSFLFLKSFSNSYP